jgi:hypothetical protein
MNRLYTNAVRDELKDLSDELQDLLTDLKLEEDEYDRPYATGMANAYKLTLKMLIARIRSLDLAVYLDQDYLKFGEDEPPTPDLFSVTRVDDFIDSVRKDCDAVIIAEASDLVAMMDAWQERGRP